jgi:predicted lipoprotein with Yx(FWY)xxD motif
MEATEIRFAARLACHMVSVAAAVALLATAVAAQPLPRVDRDLTMEQAVDLAREKSLRVKAADADARTMDSMRREALAPFWPQLSAGEQAEWKGDEQPAVLIETDAHCLDAMGAHEAQHTERWHRDVWATHAQGIYTSHVRPHPAAGVFTSPKEKSCRSQKVPCTSAANCWSIRLLRRPWSMCRSKARSSYRRRLPPVPALQPELREKPSCTPPLPPPGTRHARTAVGEHKSTVARHRDRVVTTLFRLCKYPDGPGRYRHLTFP